MKCDYKNSLQVCRGDANARYHVTVFYADNSKEQLVLCLGCTLYVVSDARYNGLEWEVEII